MTSRSSHTRTPGPIRGAALLLVLWLLVMLAALVGAFAMSAQIERLQGRVLVDGVVARQAARAGIEYAIARMTSSDPGNAWIPDGRKYEWHYHGADVELVVVDEQGKVDLNLADVDLLEALLRATGNDPGQARRVANAIVDWRDPDMLTAVEGGAEDVHYAAAGLPYGAKDAPFEGVAELQQLLGVGPDLYARLWPHVTVFSGSVRPDPAFASAQVLTALGLNGQQILAERQSWQPASGQTPPVVPGLGVLAGSGSGTYSIRSRARLSDGRQAVLSVVVRTHDDALMAAPGSAYTPLHWDMGETPTSPR